MKIGILTFHCAYNYGAMLQCYALQEQLRLWGHEAFVVNYRPDYLETKPPYLSLKGLIMRPTWRNLSNYLVNREFLKKYNKHKDFETTYYHETKACRTHQELVDEVNKMDCLILGSDQIWNHKYNGEDPAWYGGLEELSPKVRLITYAPSAGTPDFNAKEVNLLKDTLPKFDRLTVRENILGDALKRISPAVDTPKVLDPSLMASPSIWEKYFQPIRKDKYVLVYQARQDDNVYRIAQAIAAEVGAKILAMDNYPNSFARQYINKPFNAVEFVSLVKNAQFVVTTSFHGTAFSIICNTPFYTIRLNDGADERAEELLNLLGLSSRMIDKECKANYSICDFKVANKRLDESRAKSQQILKEALDS